MVISRETYEQTVRSNIQMRVDAICNEIDNQFQQSKQLDGVSSFMFYDSDHIIDEVVGLYRDAGWTVSRETDPKFSCNKKITFVLNPVKEDEKKLRVYRGRVDISRHPPSDPIKGWVFQVAGSSDPNSDYYWLEEPKLPFKDGDYIEYIGGGWIQHTDVPEIKTGYGITTTGEWTGSVIDIRHGPCDMATFSAGDLLIDVLDE